jgi:hypothetical protein
MFQRFRRNFKSNHSQKDSSATDKDTSEESELKSWSHGMSFIPTSSDPVVWLRALQITG